MLTLQDQQSLKFMSEYPKEHYIELDNNPYMMGRLTLLAISGAVTVEVDIVQKESHKIFMHVGTIHHNEDDREAMDAGVQKLGKFLEQLKQQKNKGLI